MIDRERSDRDRGDRGRPDIYADGFSINAGPRGFAIALTRADPFGGADGQTESAEIVAIVRMSPAIAQELASALQQIALQVSAGPPDSQGTIRH